MVQSWAAAAAMVEELIKYDAGQIPHFFEGIHGKTKQPSILQVD
jgi:hypothetical protein